MADRRAVVTGASTGIGESTARRLIASGWDVVGVARRGDRLERIAAETGMIPFVADLTRETDVAALRDFLAETGGVTTLVNNAGGARGLESVENGSLEDWRWMYEVNVLASKRLTSALLPLLRASVDAGRVEIADVLFVTSIAGHVAYEGGGGYNAAKFAEHAMVDVLRLESLGEPLRFLEIAPGLVHTEEFSLNRFGGDRERADRVYEGVENPLTGDDVALAIQSMLEMPPHISLDLVVIKPVAQVAAGKVHKGPLETRGAG